MVRRVNVYGVGSQVFAAATPEPHDRRRLTLALLLVVFTLNFTDRQIVAILSEPIKREFGLSDAQVGLLYGFAFAVVYSIVGIPIARWADRADRARIINASLALFSLMTVACGLAGSYWQLLLARIGVGVGEGGTNPPSHSLIADLYPVDRRSTAMAVFALGPHAGILLGFVLGGVVGQLWGWRAALITAGTAGLAVALVTSRLLKEPPRDSHHAGTPRGAASPPVRASLRAMFRHPSMRHMFIGGAVASIAAYAAIGWLPAFLIRSHDLGPAAAGSLLALLLGVLGGAGTLLGGLLADRLGQRNPAWRLRVVVVAFLAVVPFWAAALLAEKLAAAIAFLVVPTAALGVYLGPTFAMVQSLVGPTIRAFAAAVLLFVGSLVGLSAGPVLVGVLSDVLRAAHGPESLRLALLVIAPLYLWSAAHYFVASRTLAADLHAHAAEPMEGVQLARQGGNP
ncbi:MAG: MFS transporter [Burkholderiales bacterium]|nr:MFS transporter [Burkholderiales bacterium]